MFSIKQFLFLLLITLIQIPVLAIACGKNSDGFFFCKDNSWDNLASATVVINEKANFQYRFGKSSTQLEAHARNRLYRFILFKPKIFIYNKSVSLEKGFEFDSVEGIMGNLKLVTVLLNHAFPNGPLSITAKKIIHLSDSIKELEVIIDPGTVGRYGAPWSANGYISPIGENKFKFSLALKWFDRKHREQIINMNGELDNSKKNFELSDSFKLNDYRIINYNHGFNLKNLENIKTIGELRNKIAISMAVDVPKSVFAN